MIYENCECMPKLNRKFRECSARKSCVVYTIIKVKLLLGLLMCYIFFSNNLFISCHVILSLAQHNSINGFTCLRAHSILSLEISKAQGMLYNILLVSNKKVCMQ